MLKIAVFDTEKHACELEDILVSLLFDRCEFGLENYTDVREVKRLSFADGFDFDIVFADADEASFPGLATVRRMREQECIRPDVILFSSTDTSALEGYKLHAFDYLIKPVPTRTLSETLERYFKYHGAAMESSFKYKVGGAVQTAHQEDIYYFMSEARKCTLVTRSGEDEFYAKLDDVEKQLDADFFIRAHQSYLVNVRYIKSLTRDGVTMNDDTFVPISQKRYQAVKAKFMSYLGIE